MFVGPQHNYKHQVHQAHISRTEKDDSTSIRRLTSGL